MKKISTESHVVFDSPNSIFGYNAWPSVCRAPGGELAAVCSGSRMAHVCPFGRVLLSRSYDEGRSWTPPETVIDTPLDDRDAGVAVFGGVRMIVTSFNHRLDVQRAFRPDNPQAAIMAKAYFEAGCATREDEKKFCGSTYVISDDGGLGWSEVKKAPVTAPHGPAALSDGSLLYMGNPWKYDENAVPGVAALKTAVEVWHSSDGESWEKYGDVPGNFEGLTPCEPYAAELPDGRLIGQLRVQGDGTPAGEKDVFCIYQTESGDGGHTWSEARRINEAGAPPHLLVHSSGAVVCVFGHRSAPYGEWAMVSRDGCRTWSEPYELREAPEGVDLGYPASVELEDGRICTVYYQQREKGRFNTVWATVWTLPGD